MMVYFRVSLYADLAVLALFMKVGYCTTGLLQQGLVTTF